MVKSFRFANSPSSEIENLSENENMTNIATNTLNLTEAWNTTQQIENNKNETKSIGSEVLPDWKVYENPTYGIKVNYSKDWSYENQDADIDKAVYRSGEVNGLSNIVDFTLPKNIGNENSTVELKFYNLPAKTNLEQFVQGEIDDKASSKTFLGLKVPVWIVSERTPLTISNQPAEKVVFTSTFEDQGVTKDLQRMIIYTVVNGKGYAIDYTDSPLLYQNYIADVEKVANTLQVGGTTGLDKPIQWAKFEDTKLGISLEYPQGWEIEHKQSKFDEGPEVTISDNSESNLGEIKILKPNKVGSVYDAELAALTAQNAVSDKEGTRVIDDVNMDLYKVGGEDAGTFLFTTPNPLSTMLSESGKSSSMLDQFMDDYAQQILVTVHNSKMYSFGFQAPTGEFEGYDSIMDHVFKSIKFLK